MTASSRLDLGPHDLASARKHFHPELPAWPAGLEEVAHVARFADARRIVPAAEGMDDSALFVANDPGHGLAVTFSDRAVAVRSAHDPRSEALLTLELSSWGFQGAQRRVETADVTVDGARIEYRRENLVEWYLNDVSGVEQGFTLLAAPSDGDPSAPIELLLSIGGSLHAAMTKNGEDVALLDSQGVTRLRLSKLVAWDADGRSLAARMALSAGSLALVVDAARASYPITVDPLIAGEQVILTPSVPAPNTSFGTSVAVDGDTAVVGARWADYPDATDAGAAYVFVRNGTTWTEQAKLTPADRAAYDLFGSSVAIVGNTLIVGAPQVDILGGASDVGSAYVFVRSGTTWSQQAKLIPADPEAKQYFGIAAAMDGDTATVGAWGDDHSGEINAGSAYVFTRNGTSWSQQAKLVASTPETDDYFGGAVALSGDSAIVGVRWHDHGGAINQGGAAYVFGRTGTAWNQQAKLIASDASIVAEFGVAVAILGDTALVGAHADSTQGLNSAGAAYVFKRTGAMWNQQSKLVASNAAAHDHFGESVAIASDIAVIGAFGVDVGVKPNVGSAYVFERNGSSWSQRVELVPSAAMPSGEFGRSAAMSGEDLILGAPFGTGGNAAYVYRIEDCAGSLLPYGAACPAAGVTPSLNISGCASPGKTIQVEMSNAAANAPALLLIGSGSASAPLNPSCSLQVLPLLPFSLPLTFSPTGTISFPATLPPVLPQPYDLYLQTAIADPSAVGGIAATNPIHLHVD